MSQVAHAERLISDTENMSMEGPATPALHPF